MSFKKNIINDAKQLKLMLGHAFKGNIKIFSFKTYAKFILAVVYFLIPTDILPDFIPFLGQLDDLTVGIWFLSSLKTDIDYFKNKNPK